MEICEELWYYTIGTTTPHNMVTQAMLCGVVVLHYRYHNATQHGHSGYVVWSCGTTLQVPEHHTATQHNLSTRICILLFYL